MIDLSPLLVHPTVYKLPAQPLRWNWCRLGDVCTTVSGIITRLGGTFNPTPPELVNAFILATRQTQPPLSQLPAAEPRGRMFRYVSPDGIRLSGQQVPDLYSAPVFRSVFELMHQNCTPDLFVPEGWVIDVLKMVQVAGVIRIELVTADSGDGRRFHCKTFDASDGTAVFDENLKLKCVSAEVGRRIGWFK